MLSVLQNAKPGDVRLDPFPHLVIRDALPPALIEELVASYPSNETLGVDASANNKRWSCSAPKVAANPAISALWRDVIAYHASPAFWAEVAAVFADAIAHCHPRLFPDHARIAALRAGVRGVDTLETHDILLDAQLSGNTPVREPGSVRTTHLDDNAKLFAGLFYLRPDDDDTPGSDLTISRYRPGLRTRAQKLACFERMYVDDAFTEVVETVRYAKNTLVMFVNGFDALHGVTVRPRTPHRRLFMNLVGEISGELHPVYNSQKPTWLDRLRRRRALRSAPSAHAGA